MRTICTHRVTEKITREQSIEYKFVFVIDNADVRTMVLAFAGGTDHSKMKVRVPGSRTLAAGRFRIHNTDATGKGTVFFGNVFEWHSATLDNFETKDPEIMSEVTDWFMGRFSPSMVTK